METDEETPRGPRTICTSRVSKDSGYGSLETKSTAHGKLQAIQEHQGTDSIDNQEEADELQTIYSDASSLLQHPDIDKYISAFADVLSRSLPSEFDESDAERVFSALPSLLRAFAVRLGYESSERMPRQLMYLVSRFRSEIARCLKRMVHEEYHDGSSVHKMNGEGDSPRQNKPFMGLDDKIHMWLSKEDVLETDNARFCDLDEAEPGACDYLDDLGGLDDLDALDSFKEEGFLSEYRQLLSRSPAYQWLRSSIRVKSTLQVPGSDATASHIGDRIVKAVGRPNKFSRKQTQELRMHFVVPWDPFLFLQEQEYEKPLSYVLAHAITLTGHGNDLQAATCESYMRQTWPNTGLQFLEFLQRAVKSESGTCEGK
ncbi:hypothetical protein JDV02_005728 [Purpureocillium takamizusanense]|uniref:Uncharacterized protein n=1 Tax=Purpureocillium takamizusanense TaxID=2060973 RepID=A0A9Q8VBC9_9HYPO|nr:uncharacterized protein JDV02_005728 [Purpureocillium takamizusanense]UNI19548.1 hypothetical protein JDV02_005728 [Purpureocillium takamizusanense]